MINVEEFMKKVIIRVAVTFAASLGGALIFALPASALVNTADIANDAVTNAKIAAKTIIAADVAGETLTGYQIKNGSIGNADLQFASITGGKIRDGAVTGAKISSTAVLTVDSVTLGDAVPLSGAFVTDVTRATSDTGDYQPVAGDLTLTGDAGSSTSIDPTVQAGVMGNVHGTSPTATANNSAGVIGMYSISGTNPSS